MARVTESLCFLMIISVLVVSLVLAEDSYGFVRYNFKPEDLYMDGMASTEDGRLKITDSSLWRTGHAFWKIPINFTKTCTCFSTEFVFGIVPKKGLGQGMAFVVSPTAYLRYGASGSYLGLFNKTNDNRADNHIFAVEIDTSRSPEAVETSSEHIGVDVNSIISIKYEDASYFDSTIGIDRRLLLATKQRIRMWIEYDGERVNVTLAPLNIPKPVFPLLSIPIDLTKVFTDQVYLGFSGSTGLFRSDQYILGWSLTVGRGKAQTLSISEVLDLLPQPPPSSPPLTKGQVITISVISVFVFLMIPSGIMYLYFKSKYAEVFEVWEQQYSPHRFSYKTLHKATNGFKGNRVIGEGGFGKVYRGVLPDGTQVAVKKVSHGSQQGLEEYISEIATMARLGHRSLVQLLGYCRRKGELILVYELMINGNVAEYLLKGDGLSWLQRLEIIKGVASAVHYLHEGWGQVVLHRDIKASNVLLDANLNAKLGDFGLARFHDRGMALEATRVVGTLGYMAPELMTMGLATSLSDVYAFGAFVLEVICGRKLVNPNRPHEQKILVNWVSSCMNRGVLWETIDCELAGDHICNEIEIVLKLGLLCTQYNPEDRPSMSQVVNYLEGNDVLPEMPPDTPY